MAGFIEKCPSRLLIQEFYGHGRQCTLVMFSLRRRDNLKKEMYRESHGVYRVAHPLAIRIIDLS